MTASEPITIGDRFEVVHRGHFGFGKKYVCKAVLEGKALPGVDGAKLELGRLIVFAARFPGGKLVDHALPEPWCMLLHASGRKAAGRR